MSFQVETWAAIYNAVQGGKSRIHHTRGRIVGQLRLDSLLCYIPPFKLRFCNSIFFFFLPFNGEIKYLFYRSNKKSIPKYVWKKLLN